MKYKINGYIVGQPGVKTPQEISDYLNTKDLQRRNSNGLSVSQNEYSQRKNKR